MKIGCSHSISKANGMGLKQDFLFRKCQKSCSNTRHTRDCLPSDYRNSPVLCIYNRKRLMTHRANVKGLFKGDLLELFHTLSAHFAQGSKEDLCCLVWFVKKIENFIRWELNLFIISFPYCFNWNIIDSHGFLVGNPLPPPEGPQRTSFHEPLARNNSSSAMTAPILAL